MSAITCPSEARLKLDLRFEQRIFIDQSYQFYNEMDPEFQKYWCAPKKDKALLYKDHPAEPKPPPRYVQSANNN